MKNDSLFRSLSFAVFVLLFLGVSLSGQESHRVALARPASVPQNYAITPFGYFHPVSVPWRTTTLSSPMAASNVPTARSTQMLRCAAILTTPQQECP